MRYLIVSYNFFFFRHQCESKVHKNCYKHYSDTNGRNKHMRKILKEKPEKTKSEKAKKTEKTKRKPKADVADAKKNK